MMKTRACFSGLQFLQRIVCTNGFYAQHSWRKAPKTRAAQSWGISPQPVRLGTFGKSQGCSRVGNWAQLVAGGMSYSLLAGLVANWEAGMTSRNARSDV
jgi:hypothetical protein